jgi:hypothetical protein
MSTTNGSTEESGKRYTLVRYEDGTERLALARVGDLVAFEMEHDRRPDTASARDILWMVWRTLGKPEGDFQAWADTVVEFSGDEAAIATALARGDVESPPTEQLATTGDESSRT